VQGSGAFAAAGARGRELLPLLLLGRLVSLGEQHQGPLLLQLGQSEVWLLALPLLLLPPLLPLLLLGRWVA
jgi:hypothetical protein